MPQDRLTCIAATDGTLGVKAPALQVDDHAAALAQPVGDIDGSSSPPFAISLVPGKVEHDGWSCSGSREKRLQLILGDLDGSIGTPTW